MSCKSKIKLLNMEGSGKEWPHLEQEGRLGKEYLTTCKYVNS